MELGCPINLLQLRNKYLDNAEVLTRIDNYIESRDIMAIPIKSLSLFQTPITLEMLRGEIKGFMPPQMYYLLENNKKLQEYLHSFPLEEKILSHDHSTVYENNIAVSCAQMEQTEEHRNHMNTKKVQRLLDKIGVSKTRY